MRSNVYIISALVFNNANFINLKEDLTEILDIGNNLYSVLSESLTGQTFLLLIDLPGTVRIRETQYKLQFSESYHVSNLLGGCFHIEGYPYCATVEEAFDCLLRQNYSSFILTIGCSTVAIFSSLDGRFKLFDSHGRDSFNKKSKLLNSKQRNKIKTRKTRNKKQSSHFIWGMHYKHIHIHTHTHTHTHTHVHRHTHTHTHTHTQTIELSMA